MSKPLWRPGTDARPQFAALWLVRKHTPSYGNTPRVHRAVLEKVGFITTCGITFRHGEVECTPMPENFKRDWLTCGRCYPTGGQRAY